MPIPLHHWHVACCRNASARPEEKRTGGSGANVRFGGVRRHWRGPAQDQSRLRQGRAGRAQCAQRGVRRISEAVRGGWLAPMLAQYPMYIVVFLREDGGMREMSRAPHDRSAETGARGAGGPRGVSPDPRRFVSSGPGRWRSEGLPCSAPRGLLNLTWLAAVGRADVP